MAEPHEPIPSVDPRLDPSAERRSLPRHFSRERRTWLGWWKDHDFVVELVGLVDIARGGIAVEMGPDAPTTNSEVVVRLDRTRPEDCVDALVVGRSPNGEGGTLVHLSFLTTCPPPLYLAALHGLPTRGVRSN